MKTTLVLMTEIPYHRAQLEKVKTSFERKYPEVEIQIEQAADYFEMLEAFRSDSPPDLIETGGYQVDNADGVFVDHMALVEKEAGLQEDILPGLWRVITHHGILPGFPVEIGTPLIVYDKICFDEVGMPYPQPATIQAIRALVEGYSKHQAICPPTAGKLKASMEFCFPWDVPRDSRYGVVGLPHMLGGVEANMIYMGGAGVTTKSRHPELAWAFLTHYLVDCHSWTPPLTRTQVKEQGLDQHFGYARYIEELEHVQLGAFYLNRKWNASRQLINEDLLRMIEQGADIEQTVKSWTRFA